MRRWLDKLPAAVKLRVMLAYALAAALLLACLLYTPAELLSQRRSIAQQLVILTMTTSQNVGNPLRLVDRSAAHNALQPLRADSTVQTITLYDSSGNIFVEDDDRPAAINEVERLRLWGIADPVKDYQVIRFGSLTRTHIQVPVLRDGQLLGTIHVDADLSQPIYAQLRRSLKNAFFGLSLAGLAAYGLTRRLRRTVSGPVNELIRLTRAVIKTKDFAARAEKSNNDDIGVMIDGFNEILSEIERRGRSLRAYQTELEKLVRERTVELDIAVSHAQEAAKRAENASRAKSDFLARMSHEIRTPMNGVLGMAELLRHSPSLDERQRRYAVTIHQSGTGLLEIINDILDFSKIEAGKLELDKSRFCVRDIVEDAAEILAERAHAKGLELICDVPADIESTVCGDGMRLRQVIINLISNAVKFTEIGEITIKVHRLESDLLNSSFHFEVRDSGIGIKPENLALIFDSFAQEDSSTTRLYGGTGLGLAICKQIVELMGGQIGVASTPGKGSTFFFAVPLAADPLAIPDKRASVLSAAHILVVDKHAAVRTILSRHLASWGAVATEAGSAAEALQILGNAFGAQFDALMIDVHVPEMGGQELVNAIRGIPELAEIPILMMNSDAAAAPTTDSATTVWLNKPIRRAQLHDGLTRILTNDSFFESRRTTTVNHRADAAVRGRRRVSRVRRVLLVEDNPVNQEVAQAMLRELGVEAVSAWSGEEALEKLEVESFPVVLMDCQMPKLDGYAATARFREWERANGRSRTPIVALTANALSGDAEKCFAAGMDLYLSKPFTIDQLYDILESFGADPTDSVSESKIEAPVLDPQTLCRIRALDKAGSPDLLTKVVGIYTANSVALTETLMTAAALNDAEGIVHAAHALKSSSANVGAIALAELCKEMELAATRGELDIAHALVEKLLAAHKLVLQALENQRIAA